jgi:uncharacterized protein YjbI with pentapeptide repeats
VRKFLGVGGANLCEADLRGTDLCGANLSGANLRGAKLGQAKSLAGATMPDGARHDCPIPLLVV